MRRDPHKGVEPMKDTATIAKEREAQAKQAKRDAIVICGSLIALLIVFVVMLARLQ